MHNASNTFTFSLSYKVRETKPVCNKMDKKAQWLKKKYEPCYVNYTKSLFPVTPEVLETFRINLEQNSQNLQFKSKLSAYFQRSLRLKNGVNFI